MKRLAILLLILIGAYWYLSEPDWTVVDYPKGGENIIAFGDSLVTGYGASEGNDFVSLLSRRLPRPIINAGRNGDTTRSALARLQDDVLSRHPRIVILLLGGNDALRRVPLEDTFQRLASIIDRIHEKGAAVILVGVRGGLLHDSYEDRFEHLAREKRVNYVPDILEGLLGNPSLMADPIHPNDRGNITMADRIEPMLRKLLD